VLLSLLQEVDRALEQTRMFVRHVRCIATRRSKRNACWPIRSSVLAVVSPDHTGEARSRSKTWILASKVQNALLPERHLASARLGNRPYHYERLVRERRLLRPGRSGRPAAGLYFLLGDISAKASRRRC